MPDVEIPDPAEAKEKAEDPFARRVALFVAVYAVALAVAAHGGGNAAEDMMMSQQKASNAWAYFQAKSIREAMNRIEAKRLAADLEVQAATMPEPAKARMQALLDEFRAEEKRYRGEKDEIEKQAREHEEEQKTAQRRDPYFDQAEVLFQVAIVLASVAMLSGRRWPFAASLAVALLGVLMTVNGYTLLVKVPLIE